MLAAISLLQNIILLAVDACFLWDIRSGEILSFSMHASNDDDISFTQININTYVAFQYSISL